MKALDRILLARAAEQSGDDHDWTEYREGRSKQKKRSCPQAGCSGHYAGQSKLKLCPKHSAVVYAERERAKRALLKAAK